jgi:hypothetical protein
MNTDATSLDRLHDILVPNQVPWWPPAPGWYWVMALVIVILLTVMIKGLIRWQHNRYRREALAEVTRQEMMLKNPDLRNRALLGLSELLKRTAMTAFGREQVATLTGPKWFDFLDHTAKGLSFTDAVGPMLANAIYDPRAASALDEQKIHQLVKTIRHWIKHHDQSVEAKRPEKMEDRLADDYTLPRKAS